MGIEIFEMMIVKVERKLAVDSKIVQQIYIKSKCKVRPCPYFFYFFQFTNG